MRRGYPRDQTTINERKACETAICLGVSIESDMAKSRYRWVVQQITTQQKKYTDDEAARDETETPDVGDLFG